MQRLVEMIKLSAKKCVLQGICYFRLFSSFSFVRMASLVVDTSSAYLQRVENVNGDGDKQNDLILCTESKSPSNTVIFFGGDVQNYPEIMSQHRTNSVHLHWNLEATAGILAKRFPDSLVMVVRPSKMLLNTFSIYSNFVEFDQDGIPTLFNNKGALTHLTKLHSNALLHFKKHSCDADYVTNGCEQSSNSATRSNQLFSCEEDHFITIIGFSKGCVPLNQIMFEIGSSEIPPEAVPFVSKIKSVYWLDAGHNGRKDIYITNKDVLQNITKTGIQLFLHVTPYQVKDPNRPWIGQEKKKFVQILRALKSNLTVTEHHYEELGSLDIHFAILTEF